MNVYQRNILTGIDDVSITGTTSFSSNSPTLGMGKFSGTLSNGFALRFYIVGVTQGSIITNCQVGLVSNQSYYIETSPNVTISIEDSTNATSITSAEDFLSRPRISGINWTPGGGWVSGFRYYSPNLASLLQQVVNKPGWGNGYVNLFFEDNNSPSGNYRGAYSIESSSGAYPANIYMEYGEPFPHLDVINGAMSVVSGNSGHYLTRHASGGYLRKSGLETTGALILDNGIIKEKE